MGKFKQWIKGLLGKDDQPTSRFKKRATKIKPTERAKAEIKDKRNVGWGIGRRPDAWSSKSDRQMALGLRRYRANVRQRHKEMGFDYPSYERTGNVHEDRINQYVHDLKHTLGKPGYEVHIERLKRDPNIRKADVVEIHNRYMGYKIAKSTAKHKIIGKMHSRHVQLNVFKMKSASRDGRSAG